MAIQASHARRPGDGAASKTRPADRHAAEHRETGGREAEAVTATYVALLRKEAGSDYGVEFPDFPGCITAGQTLEDARRMAAEALDLHVAGMIEDHEPIPAPASLDAIMVDPHYRNAVVMLVDAPTRPTRSVRVNVMLPETLLQAIDRRTGNRSRFLAEAAREKLKHAE